VFTLRDYASHSGVGEHKGIVRAGMSLFSIGALSCDTGCLSLGGFVGGKSLGIRIVVKTYKTITIIDCDD
jgi:hypothetical protein